MTKSRILLLNIWRHLGQHRKFQFFLLFLVTLVSGFAELVSLGSLLPFLAVLSEPKSIWKYQQVRLLSEWLSLKSPSELLFPVTLLFIIASVCAAVIRIINLFLNTRLAAAIGSDLSCEAYKRTLYQPYEVHLTRNSSEIIICSTTQVSRTVSAINSFLQLITSTVVAIGLFVGLALVNSPVAFSAAFLFGGTYIAFSFNIRRKLKLNSNKVSEYSTQQVKNLQEGLGAIRDVILDGNQLVYLNIYARSDRLQRQLVANNQFLGSFPRYAVEALGLISIALLGYVYTINQGSGNSVIPFLGIFALGAQRLLPAIQQIYSSWSNIKAFNADLSAVLTLLQQNLPLCSSSRKTFNFRETIVIHNLSYRYFDDQNYVLNNINLTIAKGESIGIIGSTGSGKSTLVDILLGLLVPSDGQVLVDSCNLHSPSQVENLSSWRSSLGHVPQTIFLNDGSILQNIAFGIPQEKINISKVIQAAKQAQISEFIESLPHAYQTVVGERGVRLSGGQRQRIGIARALYKNAQVLIFDEATSALDGGTEESIMESISSLGEDLTIIMIAHRLNTIQNCDRIISLEKGVIVSDLPPKDIPRF